MTNIQSVGNYNLKNEPVIVDNVPKYAQRISFKNDNNDRFVRGNQPVRTRPAILNPQDQMIRAMEAQQKQANKEKRNKNLITGLSVAATALMAIYFGKALYKDHLSSKVQKATEEAMNAGKKGGKSIIQMINECPDEKIKRAMAEEASKEFGVSVKKINALDTLAHLDNTPPKKIDIERAKRILDEEVIGMDEAKEKIINHLKFRNHCIENNIPIDTPFVLALDGPAGTAKTTLANAVAKACDMPHKEISMAGMTGKAPIKGSEPVYSGSSWGEIADAQIEHKTRRIVYTFDEIEKAGTSEHNGKAEDALLSLMDNRHFIADDFLGVDIDVLDSIIITTSNNYEKLTEPMKSRLSKVVRIKPYTDKIKRDIAKFKANKFMKKYKMEGKVNMTENGYDALVRRHADKKGGREISNEVNDLMERIVIDDRFSSATPEKPFNITADVINELLLKLQ